MDRVREGDTDAFHAIYSRHGQAVFAYLWRQTGDQALAADLRQDVFLRLWEIRRRWQPGGSLRSFLLGVGRGLVIDHMRKLRVRDDAEPQVRELMSVVPPRPDEVTQERILAYAIEVALRQLPDRPREVFSLKRDAGLSYQEIAELLGISPRTVEVHMGRALAALRDAVAAHRETPGG